MSNDSTQPEFFELWSLRDLQIECARLNQVLVEAIEMTDTMTAPPLDEKGVK